MKRTNVPIKEQLMVEESNLQALLSVFYLHPEVEFSLTEVAEKASVAKSAASRLLPIIEERGLITMKKLGPVLRIQAHTESFEFTKRKIAWNLTNLYDSNIVEYLDQQFHHPKAIVLFGSFRFGTDQTGSDIDIAIETTEEVDIVSKRLPELTQLETEWQRPIQLHIFNREHIDANVFTSIANGIVLHGYLEVHK